MRGNFEVEESNYPIAALPDGQGGYYVTNMIGLDRLHAEPLRSREVATEIARKGNGLHRTSRQHGYKGHGPCKTVECMIVNMIADAHKAG